MRLLVNTVQVMIKLEGELREWVIVELQAFLENVPEELAGVHIGDLHYVHGKTPTLIIGHYVLQGKWTVIDKPFAVMKKQKNIVHDGLTCEEEKLRYEVVAIVRKKLVFRNRPRPIIVSR